jgi:rhodanese-related sulfurtransferase
VQRGIQVVDVREPHEYADARIPGSVLVPLGMLLRSPRESLKPGPVLFICSEGIRSAVACEAAAAIGLVEVYNLEGGTGRWQAEGYPVESGAVADRVQAPGAPRAGAGTVDFLQYLRAVSCALGMIDLVVEESLGAVADPARRCVARPEHPIQVARPEFTVTGETVEATVRTLIEQLRGRRPREVFLPTE